MPYKRIVARLDIKGETVIKGIQMEGLRVVGPVGELAREYYSQGVDEILILDAVASLYGREAVAKVLNDVTLDCFVPVTVGGGIRTLQDADLLFRAGADKVAVNSGAVLVPSLLTEIAEKYGRQAVVLQLDAKKVSPSSWECYSDSGRNPTGLEPISWARKSVELGAGEVLVTSVDADGTRRGLDTELLSAIRSAVRVPVIGSGGVGAIDHVQEALGPGDLDGVAVGASFHYKVFSPRTLRAELLANKLSVREVVLT